MNKRIPTIPDADLSVSGFQKLIQWDIDKFPHAVLFGSTGSGKTYFLKLLLGRIALHIENPELVICDFKSDDDFLFLEGSENFYCFEQCRDGLLYVYEQLLLRQSGDSKRHPLFLVFDEWASFITHLDKKDAESAKKQLSSLLMLGRSFGIHVIISQQRLDASYFNGARDNFSLVIGMGRLSKESVDMMFSDFKEIINPNKTQGYGSMLLGADFHNIRVPVISNIVYLHQVIISASRRLA